jgi:hypothetical protein
VYIIVAGKSLSTMSLFFVFLSLSSSTKLLMSIVGAFNVKFIWVREASNKVSMNVLVIMNEHLSSLPLPPNLVIEEKCAAFVTSLKYDKKPALFFKNMVPIYDYRKRHLVTI